MNRAIVLCLLILAGSTGCNSQEAPSPAEGHGKAAATSSGAAPDAAARHAAAGTDADEVRAAEYNVSDTRSPALAPGMLPLAAPADRMIMPPPDYGAPRQNRENYPAVADNPVQSVHLAPVSTFSVDVDSASYSNVRRWLNQGTLPPRDAVRIEEMINYFSYDYPGPAPGDAFRVITETGPAPWHAGRRLLHIGIQGARLEADQLAPANLVFLIDVSGSMHSPDKLDLLKASMKLLTRQLDADDRLAIAVYAGAAGTVLEPTPGDRGARIDAAIDRLSAGGSTNGGAGIELAYAMARQAFIDGGINRIILATDGDFNVGTTNPRMLEDLVARERESGIALSVLGFGSGNYNDALMQRLAQAGNGNAAYVDTLNEGRKVLVDELASTLSIIARDVKIQVEFNPAVVDEYRLLGYETRLLDRADFNDDRVDAGDIGPGHSVTALYELSLHGGGGQIDPLRYAPAAGPDTGHRSPNANTDELAFVRLRHKSPEGGASILLETPVLVADGHAELARTSDAFRFSSAVAGFGLLLRDAADGAPAPRDGEAAASRRFSYDDALALAAGARGVDDAGYRGELLGLLRTARALAGPRGVAVSGR